MQAHSRVGQFALWFFLLSVLASHPAQAQTFLAVEGGPGGGNFTSNCAPGDFVVGIDARLPLSWVLIEDLD